ncbi:hypothetical protein J437_LFUL008956 [Ladona fulva]|uniref:Uncharacterized protein n=1 Tax=Ladona fulva TaxID=123851 RepID=A0A8K0KDX7_LADFU|nr:hypothetical protein J437_LFUL008956 [Ladona fulva]
MQYIKPQTIASFGILTKCSPLMMSLQPVVVTYICPMLDASSIVVTFKQKNTLNPPQKKLASCNITTRGEGSENMKYNTFPSEKTKVCSIHQIYSSSVSPFQAYTGIPEAAIAAAAWSWVLKMLQLDHCTWERLIE